MTQDPDSLSESKLSEPKEALELDAAIAAYYEQLEKSGKAPEPEEFVLQYPEQEEELRQFFRDLEHMRALQPDISPVAEPESTLVSDKPAELDQEDVVRYFGEYEILEKLGQGGMGVVYKARDKRLGRIVALKMMRAGTLATQQDVQRFIKEGRAAGRLKHPGIVSVHEIGVYRGRHFLSMDYVGGGTLSDLCRLGPVPPKRAAELVRQIAKAMYYAHSKDVVHRDLKPGNVLLTENGQIRVADFGLARQLRGSGEASEQSLTETGQILGTAGYMAPEQANGYSKIVQAPADIYSMGAILYVLLTGRAPFVGDSVAQTLMQVINTDPVSPRTLSPGIPKDLETICLKCLEKQPHRRYPTALKLASDLKRFIDGRPIHGRASGRVEKTLRWSLRNRAITSLAMLLVFSLILLSITQWVQMGTAVTAIQNARGGSIAELAVEARRKYPDELLRRIMKTRLSSETDNNQKLALSIGLAHLGESRSEYLIDVWPEVVEEDQGGVISALRLFQAEIAELLTRKAAECETDQAWDRKASLAVLGLNLGVDAVAEDMSSVSKRSDPWQRTVMISAIGNWGGSIDEFLRCASSTEDPSLKSALLLGVSKRSRTSLTSAEVSKWLQLAETEYRESSYSVVHAAAMYFLKNRGASIPVVEQRSGSSELLVNRHGQTFSRIQILRADAEAVEREDVSQDLWVCHREVTFGDMREFLQDTAYPPTEKPTAFNRNSAELLSRVETPASAVSWQDAIMYCNWLSQKEGLRPAYRRTGAVVLYDGQTLPEWERIKSSGGYRLPTQEEWRQACCGPASTPFCHGSDETLLGDYAVILSERVVPAASRFPNSRGLFDMHGNLAEWCEAGPEGPVILGGDFRTGALNAMVSSALRVPRSLRTNTVGFRIVLPVSAAPISDGEPQQEVMTLQHRLLYRIDEPLTSVRYSSDGTKLVFGSKSSKAKLIDLESSKVLAEFSGHESPIWTVEITPDQKYVITGSEDKSLRLWNAETGEQLDHFNSSGIFSNVHYIPHTERLFATNWDSVVRSWKIEDGKLTNLQELKTDFSTLDIVVSPASGLAYVGTPEGVVLQCDLGAGRVVAKSGIHSGWIHGLTLRGEADQYISASHDQTLKLVEPGVDESQTVFFGHSALINEVRMLPDGQRFVSSSLDQTIRVWSVDTTKVVAQGFSTGDLRSVAVRPDGLACATCGFDDGVREWDLTPLVIPATSAGK